MSLSSNANTVLGCDSFTLQCSGKVHPIVTQSEESFIFKLTENSLTTCTYENLSQVCI